MKCDKCENEISLEGNDLAVTEDLAKKASWLGWQAVRLRDEIVAYCPACWRKIAEKFYVLEMFSVEENRDMDAKEKVQKMNQLQIPITKSKQ